MKGPRWDPPAFLLPTWTEAQLALLRPRATAPCRVATTRRQQSSLSPALSTARQISCHEHGRRIAVGPRLGAGGQVRTLATGWGSSGGGDGSEKRPARRGNDRGGSGGGRRERGKEGEPDSSVGGRGATGWGQTRRNNVSRSGPKDANNRPDKPSTAVAVEKKVEEGDLSPKQEVKKVLRLNYTKNRDIERREIRRSANGNGHGNHSSRRSRTAAEAGTSAQSYVSLGSTARKGNEGEGEGAVRRMWGGSVGGNGSGNGDGNGNGTSKRRTSGSSGKGSETPEKQIPLLEELFPELAKPGRDAPKTAARHMPRLSLENLKAIAPSSKPEPGVNQDQDEPIDRDPESDSPGSVRRRSPGWQLPGFTEDAEPRGSGYSSVIDPVILVLRTNDDLLSEADFRRIVPRGRHIVEWRERGSYLQVIPLRNSATLSPQGSYLLLFRNASYRDAWRNRAIHMATLATLHTPTGIDSGQILPFPGMEVKGEDVGTSLNEYALTPPGFKGFRGGGGGGGGEDAARRPTGHTNKKSKNYVPEMPRLFWHHDMASASTAVQRLINDRGYARLANRAGRSVLFWVEGFAPQSAEINRVLLADGKGRGMPWSAQGALERFEIPSANANGGGGGGGGGASGGQDEEDASYDADAYRDGSETGSEGQKNKKRASRWILEFEDETEARGFIRTWHKRKWPVTLAQGRREGEDEAYVHAELLW